MDADEVERWFGEYTAVFAAAGRGEREPADVLAFYDVPLLLSTDAGAVSLPEEAAVIGMVTQQVEAMLSSGYETSEILQAQTTVVNASTALYAGAFSRRRADGTEINRVEATYLIITRAGGPRISALLVHSELTQ